MPRTDKEKKVADLTEKLRRSQMAVITDYRGMTMPEINNLRGQLRKTNAEFHVVKNTLTKRAGDEIGASTLEKELAGPTAVAFCFGEVVDAAKLLMDFARTSKVFKIRAAYLQGQVVPGTEMAAIATLPARPVLMSQLLGALQGPTAQVVGVLNAPMQNLVAVLNARSQQLSGS